MFLRSRRISIWPRDHWQYKTAGGSYRTLRPLVGGSTASALVIVQSVPGSVRLSPGFIDCTCEGAWGGGGG